MPAPIGGSRAHALAHAADGWITRIIDKKNYYKKNKWRRYQIQPYLHILQMTVCHQLHHIQPKKRLLKPSMRGLRNMATRLQQRIRTRLVSAVTIE